MPPRRHTDPYLPRADGEFRDWLQTFATTIAADPAAYERTASEAAMLLDIAQRYDTAYMQARSPATRSKPATQAKNLIRREAWNIVRPIAMQIRSVPSTRISDALKIALRIKPRHFRGTPIRAPEHAPLLAFDTAFGGTGSCRHRLRYQDVSNPSRWAKPPGVIHLQLFVAIADRNVQPILPPSIAGRRAATFRADDREGVETFIVLVTRHVFEVEIDAVHCGRVAMYYGRWSTRRGLTGPWSVPVSMTVV